MHCGNLELKSMIFCVLANVCHEKSITLLGTRATFVGAIQRINQKRRLNLSDREIDDLFRKVRYCFPLSIIVRENVRLYNWRSCNWYGQWYSFWLLYSQHMPSAMASGQGTVCTVLEEATTCMCTIRALRNLPTPLPQQHRGVLCRSD